MDWLDVVVVAVLITKQISYNYVRDLRHLWMMSEVLAV
jgi:hypothetical protein